MSLRKLDWSQFTASACTPTTASVGMSDGTPKNVKIKQVSSQDPFHATQKKKKHWKIETEDGEVMDLVLPDTDPKPEKGQSVGGILFPASDPKYNPKLYPSRGRGGGGGGRPQKSEKEINEETARSALIRATELACAGKIQPAEIVQKTREFHAVLKELAA